ncbi:unnamed protein product [Diamesa serratosioi]
MDFKYFFMTILSFFLAFVKGEENEAPKALTHPEVWTNAKHLNNDLFERQLPITLDGPFLNTIDLNRQQNASFLKSDKNRKKEKLERRKNKYVNKNKCVFRPTVHENKSDDEDDHGHHSGKE